MLDKYFIDLRNDTHVMVEVGTVESSSYYYSFLAAVLDMNLKSLLKNLLKNTLKHTYFGDFKTVLAILLPKLAFSCIMYDYTNKKTVVQFYLDILLRHFQKKMFCFKILSILDNLFSLKRDL